MKKCLSVLMTLLMLLVPLTVSAEPSDTLENIDLVIIAEQGEDGTIYVTLEDERGYAAPYMPVSLQVDGVTVQEQVTDSNSAAEFDYDIPDSASEVAVVADSCQIGQYWMVGCTEYIRTVQPTADPARTTQEPSAETSTTLAASVGAAATTAPSLAVSPMTTAANGNRVAIGVDVDERLASEFGMTTAEFMARACLWMDKEDYDVLVSLPGATVHLELVYDQESTRNDWFTAAKNADVKYASYGDDQVKGIAFNTDLVYIEGNTRVPLENLSETLRDFQCDLQLPVPTALADASELAVSVCTMDGLSELLAVTPQNGTILLKPQAFQRLAILGFGAKETATAPNSMWAFLGSLSEVPPLILVLFIVGILLVIGGILVMIFVTFRRKNKEAANDDEETEATQDSTHRVMIEPIKGKTVAEDHEVSARDITGDVMMNHDVQAALSDTEREQYRAKPQMDQEVFARISERSVSPAKQISKQQIEVIRRESASKASEQSRSLTVDDLLDEVNSDLENLDT